MRNFFTILLVDGVFVVCGIILLVTMAVLVNAVVRNCIAFWFHEKEESLKRVSGISEDILKMYN